MSDHLVCLTFDFDAMSGMIARGLKTPTPISRGEFGAVAVDRILDLLARHDIPSTWFVPGVTVRTYLEHCSRIAAAGHEIGNHGWSHVPPANLDPAKEDADLGRANAAIAEVTGHPPRGYRSPSWDLSPVTIDLLLKHGMVYDSSMMGHDYLPYYARRGDIPHEDEPFEFGEVTGLVEMPVSWTLDDFPHFEFVRTAQSILPGLANAGLVLDNWIKDFEYMQQIQRWGVLTYTLHPFVVGRGHRMMMLDRLIRTLAEEGAQFVRMGDAVDAFLARTDGDA